MTPAHTYRTWAYLLAAAAASGAVAHTTGPAASQRTAAPPRLALIEFRATGPDGKPVVDLRPDEIALAVDAQPREIRALRAVHPDGGSLTPLPFASNTGLDRGRDVVFLLDEESFAADNARLMRDVVSQALTRLGPRDRAGLLSLHPSGASVALTRQHAAVTAALADIKGRMIGRETAIDLSCRTKRVLQGLRGALDVLQGGPTLTAVFVSGSLAAPPVAPIPQIGTDGSCPLRPNDFDDFQASLMRSGANLYVLNTVNPASLPEPSDRLGGLEKLGGAPGAAFLHVTGDPAAIIARIAGDTAAYYVAGFVPAPGEANGAAHPIDVRVRREGVKVRARPAVVIPRAEAGAAPSAAEMLRSATGFRDLPLYVTAAASRNRGDDKIKVVIFFEAVDLQPALASAAVGLFDAKGRLTAQWAAAPAELGQRLITTALVVPAGTYRLRVAAVDAAGRAGAVDDEVRAELMPAGPAKVSALALGEPAGGSLSPRLEFPATVAAAVAYLEIYGLPKGAVVTASLELTASAGEKPILTAPASLTPSEDPPTTIVFGGFEIGALPARDYLITAVITIDGKVVARVSRTLRKTS